MSMDNFWTNISRMYCTMSLEVWFFCVSWASYMWPHYLLYCTGVLA